MKQSFCAALTLLALAAPASASTIILTDEECTRMAALSADAPHLSWASSEVSPGVYSTKSTIYLKTGKCFLIVFPLDKIPKGQRITNAELTIPVAGVDNESRLTVRRVLGAWGAGVNHKYRTLYPKPIPWTRPGAAGASSDGATKASAQVDIKTREDKTINVTEDIELWYTGVARNNGWIFRADDKHAMIHLLSPLSTYPNGRGRWKLRITYEPEE